MGDERVGKGGVALVAATVEVFVVGTDILTSETLDDNHHDILLFEGLGRIGWLADGVEDGHHLGLGFKVVGHLETIEAIGANQREGGVEYDARLCGTIAVVVGIRDGDGAHITGPATSHSCYAEGRVSQQGKKGGYGVRLPL